ncbi:1-phosphofructokinase family hexose kinase [Ginsengibacter hankyongi]|uniref:1-phosphofructokinase family hexose kinase n=1 Tax=Ginsengibacter hankyongi TaxID=2607284 RepID=A0A5J5IMJ3_9BACT|nr:1-phosphofructokinase family hexose kinase [Ginsengibacter hankyongi]KAA9041104.1 1-phosphofructokinase family hexose kinase [Ginsengibacter hankyongi]
MSKIITITFSPCIDKSTSVPSLIPEKKLQCSAPKLEPGGGGINVARALRKLGEDAIAIFPSGGYTGKFFNHLMELENINCKIIEIKNETRENIIVLDQSINAQYRLGMPGSELAEHEWKACLQAVEEINNIEFIIASGSLPPGVPVNIYAMLAEIAKNKNAKLIVDTSGEALKEAVQKGLFLLKPNIGELAYLAGKDKLLPGEIAIVAKKIIEKGQCEAIVISMGMEGATIITKDTVDIITAPKVTRKSTVGAGDSMVAGIVFFLSTGKSLLEAAKFGVACGTAATMNPGTELCKRDDAFRLYNSMCTAS